MRRCRKKKALKDMKFELQPLITGEVSTSWLPLVRVRMEPVPFASRSVWNSELVEWKIEIPKEWPATSERVIGIAIHVDGLPKKITEIPPIWVQSGDTITFGERQFKLEVVDERR